MAEKSSEHVNVVLTYQRAKKSHDSTFQDPINHTYQTSSSKTSSSKDLREKNSEVQKRTGVDPRFAPKAPFTSRLVSIHSPHLQKIVEIFSQVKVNIPLLDAITQFTSYAKFLRDLCTKKTSNVSKKAFLPAHVSSILCNNNFAIKYKDYDFSLISCTIDNTRVEICLLDIGFSVDPFISSSLPPTRIS